MSDAENPFQSPAAVTQDAATELTRRQLVGRCAGVGAALVFCFFALPLLAAIAWWIWVMYQRWQDDSIFVHSMVFFVNGKEASFVEALLSYVAFTLAMSACGGAVGALLGGLVHWRQVRQRRLS